MDAFIAKVIEHIINPLILAMFAVAIFYFLWGFLSFFLNPENEEKRTRGKVHMLAGTCGICVMMGVWFWMGLILRTLHVDYVKINEQNNKGQIEVDIKP